MGSRLAKLLSPTHAAHAVGRITPGKTTLTDARGAGRPGIASELSTLAPALVCGGDGARVRARGVQGRAGRGWWCGVELDETPCAREGAGRLAPHKHAPTRARPLPRTPGHPVPEGRWRPGTHRSLRHRAHRTGQPARALPPVASQSHDARNTR